MEQKDHFEANQKSLNDFLINLSRLNTSTCFYNRFFIVKCLFLLKKLTMAGDSSKHIIQSLVVNLLIVVAKAIAAFVTSSGAMLAETIHSTADCANQLLLLLGLKQSKRPADAKHPFGYGMSVYFWSFMVAVLLFSVGGMFSIYEGIHKYTHPESVHDVLWGVAVLIFSIILEGYATYSNVQQINKIKGKSSFIKYIKNTKESDLIVVFGENSAAVLGLLLALIALLASYYTNDPKYDALGSLCIGIVLILVAIFLSVEVKSLLIGESADPEIENTINEIIKSEPEISELINCRTIQQGPGTVLVCMKIKLIAGLNSQKLSILINHFESKLRQAQPKVKYIYVEPDLQEWKE
jgi:cation diffusion facilitator family transporter